MKYSELRDLLADLAVEGVITDDTPIELFVDGQYAELRRVLETPRDTDEHDSLVFGVRRA